MREIARIIPLAICVLASQAAAQQGGWLIESSNVVSPSQPTTTVEVWAWFDDSPRREYAFALGDFDFIAGDGLFSNAQVRRNLLYPGLNPGVVNGNVVDGVFVGQFVSILGYVAIEDNPILVWTADWTTSDFTPRTVDLATKSTTTFRIARVSTGAWTQLYPQGFTPGTGVIEVVPSPASMTPLLALGALTLRRRRKV